MTLRPFLVFGEYVFDGGASPLVCLHESDGTVHGVDLEPPWAWNKSDWAGLLRALSE